MIQYTIEQFTIVGIAENNSTFKTQHSTFKLIINVLTTNNRESERINS